MNNIFGLNIFESKYIPPGTIVSLPPGFTANRYNLYQQILTQQRAIESQMNQRQMYGGKSITVPLTYSSSNSIINYEAYEDLEDVELDKLIEEQMGKLNIGGVGYDPNNITGKQLADIGRFALTGKKLVDEQVSKMRGLQSYTDIGWLNMRVEEICQKGRL